jgi:hypothetical protein
MYVSVMRTVSVAYHNSQISGAVVSLNAMACIASRLGVGHAGTLSVAQLLIFGPEVLRESNNVACSATY